MDKPGPKNYVSKKRVKKKRLRYPKNRSTSKFSFVIRGPVFCPCQKEESFGVKGGTAICEHKCLIGC